MSIKLDRPKYYTRLTSLKSIDNYAVNRVTMVKRWTIIDPNVKAQLVINGIEINSPELDGVNFDVEHIRQILRDTEDNNMYVLDATIFGNQLSAAEHYQSFPPVFLNNFIFTGDLRVRFKIISDNPPNKISIEEEYALSDHQIKDRLRTGDTLESLDINNRDAAEPIEVNI